MDVTVTPAAERFIRRMVHFSGGNGLRLRVTAGGCSGLAAEFSVESEPRPGDAVLQTGDIILFLPAESRLLLEGVTVDFKETATETGLTFFNPKAKSCACSTESTAAHVGNANG